MRTLAPAPADKQTPIAPAAGISAPIAVIPGRLIAITRPVMVCDIISHFVSCEHRLSLFGFLSLVRPKHRKQERRKCPAGRSKEDQCDDYEEKIHHRLSLVSEHQVSRRSTTARLMLALIESLYLVPKFDFDCRQFTIIKPAIDAGHMLAARFLRCGNRPVAIAAPRAVPLSVERIPQPPRHTVPERRWRQNLERGVNHLTPWSDSFRR
jgi:hypothetical protein